MSRTVTAVHHCLICGTRMSRYDGWVKATPPTCYACGDREVFIHGRWFRPGPLEIAAVTEQAREDARRVAA